MCEMADSIFCLVLRGAAAWSPRLDEAIFAGCIPVMIVDQYDPPYSRILNYSEFTVMLDEEPVTSTIGSIKEKLTKISPAHRSHLRTNLNRVRAVFRYDDIESPNYQGNGMFELTMFQLWRERAARAMTVQQVLQPRK
jgi:hypothetical protein